MGEKIRCRVIHEGYVSHKAKIEPGATFEDKRGNTYNSPDHNAIVRTSFLGMTFAYAAYQQGVINAKPAFIEKPEGLTGQDFTNLNGEWLVSLVRKALLDNARAELKQTLILVGSCAAAILSGYGAYKLYQIAPLILKALGKSNGA